MEDSTLPVIKPLFAPPPTKIASKILSPVNILFLLPIAALLAACPPPGGGGTPTTYTTTVSGKVTTPAGKAVATARVWASTDTTTKVTVGTDGSYSIEVVDHPGTFTVSADYTATDGNYKAVAPQSVSTTTAVHTQDIALKYGYTITVSGQVIDVSGTAVNVNGATVTARVEGRVVASVTSSGTNAAGNPAGNYTVLRSTILERFGLRRVTWVG